MQCEGDGLGPTLLRIGLLAMWLVLVVLVLLAAAFGGDDVVRVGVKVRLRLVDAGEFIHKLGTWKISVGTC